MGVQIDQNFPSCETQIRKPWLNRYIFGSISGLEQPFFLLMVEEIQWSRNPVESLKYHGGFTLSPPKIE